MVPGRTKGAGRTISGSVDLADLGGGDPSTWGYQVVMQSNEGFPAATDLLTRKVNEYEGQHRFGGGNDGDCDPHAMDVLAGDGSGDAGEAQAQYDMLKYECNPDGTSKTMATPDDGPQVKRAGHVSTSERRDSHDRFGTSRFTGRVARWRCSLAGARRRRSRS